jgi:protein phosphatase
MHWLWESIAKRWPQREAADQAPSESSSQPSDRAAKGTTFAPQQNVCAITDVGRVRDHNEDLYYISPDCTWFVVADGMGGHEAGDVAAALAIEAIVEHLNSERLSTATKGCIGSLLLDAVTSAHTRVREENRKRESGKEMGCTLALGYLSDGLVTCHVGDVRFYILHEGALHQITHDHSTVGALVEAGELTPEEARVHPNKNEVLQAIGMPQGVLPDVNNAKLMPGDRILLCSDGLWEALSQDEIQMILTSDGTMRQLATQLVDRAKDAGGFDNITVILCEVLPSLQSNIQNGGSGSSQNVEEGNA